MVCIRAMVGQVTTCVVVFGCDMCTSPLDGWYARERNATGKRSIVFKQELGFADRPITVPCGRCMECRLRKKRAWALRCEHEASLHTENCWFALTYDNKSLPENGSLRRKDLSDFLKRLRSQEAYDADDKKRTERRFKFFACGEYGGRFDRPHYHVLLFGYDFTDKKRTVIRNGYQQYESETLTERWGKGICEIGTISSDGFGYLAKYVTKKRKEVEQAFKDAGLEPEFLLMSRGGRHGKGIGYDWWRAYGEELLQHDSCIMNKTEVSVPQYYDKLNEISESEVFAKVKAKRRSAIKDDEGRGSRLLARQKVVEGGVNLYEGV